MQVLSSVSDRHEINFLERIILRPEWIRLVLFSILHEQLVP